MSFNQCRIIKALRNVTVSVRPVRHIHLQTCSFARGTHGFRSRLPTNFDINKNLTEEASFVNNEPPEIITLDKNEVENIHRKIESVSPKINSEQQLSEQLSRPQVVLPYYQKLGDADKKFGSLMLLLKSKKERERKKLILLEGQRLIQDALDAGVRPHSIFFSRKESLQNLKFSHKSQVEIFKLQYKHIQLWSNLTTSPGIIGVFETPKEKDLSNVSNVDLPVTLVCDNVREPGNLGAILRVAAGVGCKQVLLTKGCIDLWEPKVLRSGAGAHFRVPIQQNIQWEHIQEFVQEEKASVYLADNKYSANTGLPMSDYVDINFAAEPGQWLLVLGGETEGLSAEAHNLALCALKSSKLHIPLCGEVDSLNVAAALAVIMFEMRRQRLPRISDSTTEAVVQ